MLKKMLEISSGVMGYKLESGDDSTWTEQHRYWNPQSNFQDLFKLIQKCLDKDHITSFKLNKTSVVFNENCVNQQYFTVVDSKNIDAQFVFESLIKTLSYTCTDLDVVSHYYNNDRLYHTLTHGLSVGSLARYLANKEGLSDNTLEDLYLAGLWHDAIYIPGSKENEALSAQAFLEKYPDKEHVAEWIRGTTTTHHISDELVSIEQDCLLDADLSSLAIPYPMFKHNCEMICLESKSNLKDQADFLMNFLKKTRIYRTKTWSICEEPARNNILQLYKETHDTSNQ